MALCQLPQHCGICIDNKAAFTRNLFINRSTGRQTRHLNSFNRNFWGSSTTTEREHIPPAGVSCDYFCQTQCKLTKMKPIIFLKEAHDTMNVLRIRQNTLKNFPQGSIQYSVSDKST